MQPVNIPKMDWCNWQWQFRNLITNAQSLSQYLTIAPHYQSQIEATGQFFTFAATPYYASLSSGEPNCPIWKQLFPNNAEWQKMTYEQVDPLAEERDMPIKGVTHRYPDRAIWYVSHICAVYCRFCTRKRKVGNSQNTPTPNEIEDAICYFRNHTEIKEVILSGGDPLSLSDIKLDFLLKNLKQIEHINQVRIHTRLPVTLPFRITDNLCKILKKYFPIYIVTHFNHAHECTIEAEQAIHKLICQANCPVLNQSVLLKGVNDTVTALKDLFYSLTRMGIRPYYLHQCDEVFGSSHFRVSIAEGIDLMKQLRGYISGISLPLYVVDLTGGGGKIPIPLDYLQKKTATGYQFQNFEGQSYSVSF